MSALLHELRRVMARDLRQQVRQYAHVLRVAQDMGAPLPTPPFFTPDPAPSVPSHHAPAAKAGAFTGETP